MTEAQQKQLQELEGVIKKGWSTFLDVGKALVTINQERLYRDKFGSFDAYCREELGFSRPYAYNLIGSAKVSEQLSSIEDIKVKPETESQCRELLRVPEEKRVDAWKESLKQAGNAPVTAKIVHKAAARFKPKKAKKTGKGTVKKAAATKPIDLKPALKLLAKAEKVAGDNKDEQVLKELTALRKCLEALARK